MESAIYNIQEIIMKTTVAHNSKEFFIGGNMVLIRPLLADEPLADYTYQDLITSGHLTALGELQQKPLNTLAEICVSDDTFVYIAVSEEDSAMPLGVSLYVKNDVTDAHEMSILVSKQFVDTRLPFELAESLIQDASSHQVMTLSTIDRSDDKNMRELANKLGMSVRWMPDRQTRYSLQVDEHPGVVVF